MRFAFCLFFTCSFSVADKQTDKDVANLVAVTHLNADLSHASKERTALIRLLKHEGTVDGAANALLDTFANDVDLLVESMGPGSDDDDDGGGESDNNGTDTDTEVLQFTSMEDAMFQLDESSCKQIIIRIFFFK